MRSSAGSPPFKTAGRKVCCKCRQIAEELEGHAGLWNQTTTMGTVINTWKGASDFKLHVLKSGTLPFCLDKGIFHQKGCRCLWERKTDVKEKGIRAMVRNWKESHENSWRVHFTQSSWGEYQALWEAPLSSNQPGEREARMVSFLCVKGASVLMRAIPPWRALGGRWRAAMETVW